MFLKRNQVLDQLSIDKFTFYQLMSRGEFPEGIPICDNVVRWTQEDVDCFIAKKLEVYRS